jgi:hypothetical protein
VTTTALFLVVVLKVMRGSGSQMSFLELPIGACGAVNRVVPKCVDALNITRLVIFVSSSTQLIVTQAVPPDEGPVSHYVAGYEEDNRWKTDAPKYLDGAAVWGQEMYSGHSGGSGYNGGRFARKATGRRPGGRGAGRE